MKKVFFSLLTAAAMCFVTNQAGAQQIKVGVFDLDVMVTAMPDYVRIDSLLNIYQRDSLGAEYDYYVSEYGRIDSTLRNVDTPGVKTGKVTVTALKMDNDKKTQLTGIIINWKQYAQQKFNNKKGQLSQPLYNIVGAAYERIVKAKGYAIVLKPGTYEFGPRYDNLFISVARDLKLTQLPQELIVLGIDPETPAQGAAPAATTGGSGAKPAGTKPASH